MKKYIFCLLLFPTIIFLSCNSFYSKDSRKIDTQEIVSRLSTNDTINLLDLSNQNLKEIPDLSNYKIRKLDISNNNLDSLLISNLPSFLCELDASNNNISNKLNFISVGNDEKKLKTNTSRYLKKINLSHNRIEGITFYMHESEIDSIILSNNNLTELNLYLKSKKINYLDISFNKNFSNIITFNPNHIKTIKAKNIANSEKLKLVEYPIILEKK